MNIIRLILIITCVILASHIVANAQDEPKVCISQAAANQCAANTRELAAANEKNAVLEAAIAELRKSIAELQEVNRQNTADLTKANTDLLIKLATATGQIIQLEADRVRWNSVIDVLVKNSRQKRIGLNIF